MALYTGTWDFVLIMAFHMLYTLSIFDSAHTFQYMIIHIIL